MEKTLFILGAGASYPYGLPLGWELKNILIKLTANNAKRNFTDDSIKYDDFSDTFSNFSYDLTEINYFSKTFLESSLISIDRFLNHNPEFNQLGKRLISYVILAKENYGKLYNLDNNQNWYSFFWNRLVEEVSFNYKLLANKFNFITFNYDRSLEYFLSNAINETYNHKFDMHEYFPIFHVYGQTGILPYKIFQGGLSFNPSDIKYGTEPNYKNVNQAATEINIISPDRKNDSITQMCSKLLEEAERIFFLGFGYDTENLKIIGFDQFQKSEHQKLYGTAFNFYPNEINKIPGYFSFDDIPNNLNNYELLRKYF